MMSLFRFLADSEAGACTVLCPARSAWSHPEAVPEVPWFPYSLPGAFASATFLSHSRPFNPAFGPHGRPPPLPAGCRALHKYLDSYHSNAVVSNQNLALLATHTTYFLTQLSFFFSQRRFQILGWGYRSVIECEELGSSSSNLKETKQKHLNLLYSTFGELIVPPLSPLPLNW